MNILYDGPFSASPKGGIVRYFHEISRGILKENNVFFSRRPTGRFPKGIHLPPFAHFRPHRLSFYLEYLWHRFCSNYNIDIVHPTEFQLSPTGSLYSKKGAKLVITIHDLIHERFGAPGNLYSKASRTNFYNRADGYIFVSKSTRDDFEEFYPKLIGSRPSKVIWHGCNFPIKENENKNPKKQFLFVGSRSGYKNFINAAKAFCKVADEDKDCSFVIAGAPPKLSDLKILKNYENQISWVEFPEEKHLRTLYAKSLALLYVSEYEGFGMPLLEAMAQGCIPIAGIHSSIPEVLGDAGIMVNVKDSAEISRAMLKCLNNRLFLIKTQQKGLIRTQKFSWKKSAKETLGFYKSL